MKEIEVLRKSHLVDPSLHIWGWEVPVYLFLGGLTAGLMIFAALLSWKRGGGAGSKWVRRLPFLAPAILSLGMLALLLDLEHKTHVFRFYTTFRWSSPMSWGAWILVLIYPATLLFGLAGLNETEVSEIRDRLPFSPLRDRFIRVREAALAGRSRLEWANLLLGVALGTYTGILLSTLGARPLWSSGLLGPLFLVSGISTGAALLMFFSLAEGERRVVRNLDMAAIALELVLILLFFLDLVSASGQAGRQAAALLLGGAYTAEFWSLVAGGGLLVPLVLEAVEARRKVDAGMALPVLLLVGGFALRWILVSAGQGGW